MFSHWKCTHYVVLKKQFALSLNHGGIKFALANSENNNSIFLVTFRPLFVSDLRVEWMTDVAASLICLKNAAVILYCGVYCFA